MNTSMLNIVQRALWEGTTKKPDNEVIDRPDWVQVTTPRAPTAHLNGVLRCEVTDESIEQKVIDTIAHYKKLNLPFRWKIAPTTRPSHLNTLLEKHGMTHKETLFGLVAGPGQLSIPTNNKVVIEELHLNNLEDWLQVQASAWQVPPPGIEYIRRQQTEVLKSGKSQYCNYVAYLDKTPVASAALRFFDDYALLLGAAVNPTHRGQGVYRSLLAHRLDIIGKRSLPIVNHCLSHTSAPICLKLGFEKVCEIYSFEPA